jgi:hypothetical protein
VAHSGSRVLRRLRSWAAVAFALSAGGAWAITLGEPQVRSALGEALDVLIPVTLGPGESIEPSCFALSRDAPGEIPRLGAARISVQRSADGTLLRVRTATPVNDPALVLGVTASCPGTAGEFKRDFSLLLDPRPTPRAAPASGAPGAIAAIREITTTLIARIGDTLESIANAIFPRNRAARKSYIEALRETNPPLAALGDNEPIPLETPIALPDLRTFAHARPKGATDLAAAPARPASAPAPASRRDVARAPVIVPPTAPRKRAEPEAMQPRPVAPRIARAPAEHPARERPTAASTAAERGRATPGFVLKLSSAQVDLSRSNLIDDRSRAQLRERLTMLDADDQVAVLLALRNSVRQLESRVAELQLKLSGMPASFPPPKTAEPPKVAEAPKAPPPKVEAPKPIEPPRVVEPPKVADAPKAVPAAPIVAEVPKATEPDKAVEPLASVVAPKVEAPAAELPKPEVRRAEPAKAAAPPEVFEPRKPDAKSWGLGSDSGWVTYLLWGLVVLLIAAAGLLAWRLARRAKTPQEEEDYFEPPALEAPAADDEIVVADEQHGTTPAFAEESIEPVPPSQVRREIDADVDLPTRLGENTDDLRRRYIEERFPEITKGAIVLDDPDSVVKGARLFYEDGAVTRAVELLQYACERSSGEVKPWLALFEIFRLERLSGEYAALARRFRERHGKGDYWRKVQYFGREIDPGNTLYQEDPLNTFETIGPSQAKRIAAEASFDPVAENWLGAPMDFENEVLVNDLRKALMAEAGVHEEHLVPNPMPALRNVEMFNIA